MNSRTKSNLKLLICYLPDNLFFESLHNFCQILRLKLKWGSEPLFFMVLVYAADSMVDIYLSWILWLISIHPERQFPMNPASFFRRGTFDDIFLVKFTIFFKDLDHPFFVCIDYDVSSCFQCFGCCLKCLVFSLGINWSMFLNFYIFK